MNAACVGLAPVGEVSDGVEWFEELGEGSATEVVLMKVTWWEMRLQR